VRWPDRAGTVQNFGTVPANHFLRLKQGESAPWVVEPLR